MLTNMQCIFSACVFTYLCSTFFPNRLRYKKIIKIKIEKQIYKQEEINMVYSKTDMVTIQGSKYFELPSNLKKKGKHQDL